MPFCTLVGKASSGFCTPLLLCQVHGHSLQPSHGGFHSPGGPQPSEAQAPGQVEESRKAQHPSEITQRRPWAHRCCSGETPVLGQKKPQVSRPHRLSKGHLEAQGRCVGSENSRAPLRRQAVLSGSADVFTGLNRTRGQARKLKLMGHLPRSALRWGSLAHPLGPDREQGFLRCPRGPG